MLKFLVNKSGEKKLRIEKDLIFILFSLNFIVTMKLKT